METTTIYSLTDPTTKQVRYIGKTVKSLDSRLKRHLSNYYLQTSTRKINWIKSLKKKGLKPTIQEVDVVETKDWEWAERYWIAQFKEWGFDLTNTTEGGGGYGCFGLSEDIGRKISEAKKGVKFSEEHKKNMGLARMGSKNPLFGKHHSKETKEKMRQAALGRKGKPHTEEGLRIRSIPILQYTREGEYIKEWFGAAEAAKQLGFASGENIGHCLKGRAGAAYNYIWKYKKRINN